MKPKELERRASALYGDRWQSDFARAIDVADRTVRRWIAGEREIPPGVEAELDRLERRHKAAAALEELARRQEVAGATDAVVLEIKASSARRYPMTVRAIADVLEPLGIKLRIGGAK
jgi:hypothetical protein